MKIPKRVNVIGMIDIVKFQYSPAHQSRAIQTFSPDSDYLFCVNNALNTLFIFRADPISATKSISNKNILNETEYKIPDVHLKKIGIVKSIQYVSDWFFDEQPVELKHVFETCPALYADKLTRFNVMAIKHDRGVIMTDEGVIG